MSSDKVDTGPLATQRVAMKNGGNDAHCLIHTSDFKTSECSIGHLCSETC